MLYTLVSLNQTVGSISAIQFSSFITSETVQLVKSKILMEMQNLNWFSIPITMMAIRIKYKEEQRKI